MAASAARLELWCDGAALSQVPLMLPKPDPAGRVDYQAQLPIGSLPHSNGSSLIRDVRFGPSTIVTARLTTPKPIAKTMNIKAGM